uniref:Transmembrane protein n=1 Tax=Panagrolaimus sp. ES5 TaxID=591445 RepID=A0AC34FF22_9BILA
MEMKLLLSSIRKAKMVAKFILYAFITVFVLKEVTADCSADQLNQVQTCYTQMFQTIQARNNVTYTMSYSSYSSIFSTAYTMWEGYQAICPVHNTLQNCLKGAGIESCINKNDLSNANFVKQDSIYSAQAYTYDYLRYNYMCSQLNNSQFSLKGKLYKINIKIFTANRDTYTCYKQNLAFIPEANCTNNYQNNFAPDCFTYKIYMECVKNYANAVCGEQSQCMTQKLYTLKMCNEFGNKDQPSCGVCTAPLVGSTDPLTSVCTDATQNNGSILPTLSFSLLFFVTLVFQLFVKN